MRHHARASLFGGALFAAGIAAAEPQFTYFAGPDTINYAYAYDYTTGTVAYASGGVETLSFDVGDASITSAIEPSRLFIDAVTRGAGEFSRAQSFIRVNGSVTEDTPITVRWDFRDDIFGSIEIENITGPTMTVFSVRGTDPANVGTVTLNLFAEELYRFRMDGGAGGFSAGVRNTFVSVVVPAPASAALLGAAGLALAGRRRGPR